jgi:hypothetical protein
VGENVPFDVSNVYSGVSEGQRDMIALQNVYIDQPLAQSKKGKDQKEKTYNTRYSLVVTDPTTNPALRGLTMGERTGPRILHELWSYVEV